MATTIAVLYRGQIAALRDRITWLERELEKRDNREDRLIGQLGRATELLDRDVSLHERERGMRR